MKNIEYFGDTNMGMVRKNNEDALVVKKVWDDRHLLCIAIDGVGGYEGGEVAAQIAQDTMSNYIERYPACEGDECLDLMKQALAEANNIIYTQRTNSLETPNMSCVLTAALIDMNNNMLFMSHVGDTRLYMYNDGELRKLSHDHSLVGYQEEIGVFTEEQAMNHPHRNIIERSVGYEMHGKDDRNFIEAEAFEIPLGAQLLFCSDGLTDMITSADIKSVLCQDIDVSEKVIKLIDLANEKGGRDNVTVIVAKASNEEFEIARTEPQTEPEPPVFEKPSEEKEAPQVPEIETPQKKNNLGKILLIFFLGILTGAGVMWPLFGNNSQISEIDTVTYASPIDSIKSIKVDTIISGKAIIAINSATITELKVDSIEIATDSTTSLGDSTFIILKKN